MKKPIHLLPNILTAFGLSCGLFVIFRTNLIPTSEVNPQVLTMMAGILLLAACADLLDGAVARAMKIESDFGGLFDSLADSVTFGVAPSVVVLKSFHFASQNELSFVLTTGAMIYSVCGILRLVRFNVMAFSAKGNEEILKEEKTHFTGLPIPGAAAAVVSLNLLLVSDRFTSWFTINQTVRAWILFVSMVFLGYLMVSKWKFPSLKNLRLRVSSFRAIFGTVVFAALIFYGLFNHFSIAFATVSWSYIVVAIILALIRLISGKKSETLEDFEPEEDDF